ncbi:MAG TPA: T9SS type A sorting domain-containing protein [Prolixibacteraceae bacterium]|jgi:hypothetical protein
MKRIYIVLWSFLMLMGIGTRVNAQSLTVSGPVFLPQDSISFTFSRPGFNSTDWIGIYKVGETPGGGPESTSWDYIKSATGTLKLKPIHGPGKYIAYLLCCDGYDIVATSAEFSIVAPSLTTSYPIFVQGDSIVFSYISPKFTATDKIAIYREGTKPSKDNPAIDSKYITNSIGTITFKTSFEPRGYDAYLLCCDGLDSISAVTFQVVDPSVAFVTVKKVDFPYGATLEFSYNDPNFATGDRIAIYKDGEPSTGDPFIFSLLATKFGKVSFPGVLASGSYYAVIKGSGSDYSTSDVFNVLEKGTGSYIKTAADVYPLGSNILVNYKDDNYSNKDRIGIYKNGQVPGGPAALVMNYAPSDSSTLELNSLALGDYVVYLLCCDGFDIKASYAFKVVGLNIPSIVLPAISFEVGDPLEFKYNDPFVSSGSTTEWIGIYHEGELPYAIGSTVWDYLVTANGTMTFSVPYPFGTLPEQVGRDKPLPAGEYYAGLFYNDGYGVLAQTSFIIVEVGTGVSPEYNMANRLTLFPNPTSGLVTVKISNTAQLQQITVYNLAGQAVYKEVLKGSVNQKTLDLKHLGKGIYFVEALADNYKTSQKLIIK